MLIDLLGVQPCVCQPGLAECNVCRVEAQEHNVAWCAVLQELQLIGLQGRQTGSTRLERRGQPQVGGLQAGEACRLAPVPEDHRPGVVGPPWHDTRQLGSEVVQLKPILTGVANGTLDLGRVEAHCLTW